VRILFWLATSVINQINGYLLISSRELSLFRLVWLVGAGTVDGASGRLQPETTSQHMIGC